MKVFLEQWLDRIPEFHIPPGETPRTSSGPVNGVLYLPLAWVRGMPRTGEPDRVAPGDVERATPAQ
jgi:hypothetical protein